MENNNVLQENEHFVRALLSFYNLKLKKLQDFID